MSVTASPDPAPAALSMQAAAARLGVHRVTVWRMHCAGQIHTVKMRGRRLVPASEIARILALDVEASPAPTTGGEASL